MYQKCDPQAQLRLFCFSYAGGGRSFFPEHGSQYFFQVLSQDLKRLV